MSKFFEFMKKSNIYISLCLVVLVIILGIICYILSCRCKEIAVSMFQIAKPLIPTSKELAPGSIGEVLVKDERTGKEQPLVDSFTPPVTFNTLGEILEIKEDSLIIQGSGSNFADKTPRTLTITFTDSTLTFEKNQVYNYEGGRGLFHLKPGMKVLIEGYDNIRGKTEFQAKTINIID